MSRLELEREAVRAILARVGRLGCPVPGCPGVLQWQRRYPAEPDTGTRAWRGGVNCDTCGFLREDEPREDEP